MDEDTFVTAARADCAASDPGLADAYDRAAPYWHCYRGLERYWRKRQEAGMALEETQRRGEGSHA